MKQKVNLRFLLTLVIGIFVSASVFAQNMTVKGNVKDATGEAVIGASVIQKGNASHGCVTDYNGDFTLSVPQGSTIVVSYIGYVSQELSAKSNMQITLQEDTHMLAETVVIGYGTVKKNDMTGAVTAIKPDEMNHGLQTSVQDMLSGKVAGVSVISSGGAPGGAATIRIRGGSSLNAKNDPLIVIDGLAMDSYGGWEGSPNALAMVNPNDIESFTILKDASATAIYGSRASNGVIIITTKKGKKSSGPKVSYNGNVSVSANVKYMDVLNASEFMALAKQATLASGVTEAQWLTSEQYQNLGYYDAEGNHKFADTNWQKEIYRTAVSTDHNITITGGLKNMPYRVGLGYTHQDGTLKTSDYNRYTASFNVAPTFLDDHLTVNVNGKFMYSRTHYANTSAIGQALSMDPTKPIYGDEEEYGGYWQWPNTADFGDATWTHYYNSNAVGNPVASLYNQNNIGKSRDIMGNVELDYKIHGFEDLHLHVNGGMDVAHGHSNKSVSPYDYSSNIYYGSNGWNTTDQYNLSLNAYAQYLKDFNEDNHFDVMAGYEWQHFHKKTDYSYPKYYPSTNLEHAGELYDENYFDENHLYKTENYLVSFFGRMNYQLKNRYLFTFTLRDDGSSRFAKSKRWGLFPSAALAWKVNEEAFLRDSKTVSDLKLRLGWGITGQQEQTYGDYLYMANYTVNKAGAYYYAVGDGTTYRPEAYNPDLTWEKTTTYNVGFDLGLFNNRVTANVDWYYRKTTDLLNTGFVALGSNFAASVLSNIGSLHNTGIEANLTWRAIEAKDWRWELGYNVTWNKNKIDELVASQGEDYTIGNAYVSVGMSTADSMVKAWRKGQASSAFFVFQQVYDENGQPVYGEFVDRNADGVLDNQDKYFYKKADADVLMGFTSKLIYKKWDLSFSLRASLNNYMYNSVEASDNSNLGLSHLYNGNSWHNAMSEVIDKHWTAMDADASASDYFIQNASFLKCDNITLGYSFDHIGKSGINGRVYATAQNVFTVTKYKGMDPEISGGYDSSIYPRPFTGILGVSLNF